MPIENEFTKFLTQLEVMVKQQGTYKVAKKAGISANTVYGIFKENARPNLFTVLKICNAVGINFYFHDEELHMARKFSTVEEAG